jgi:hypothetical protein
MKLSAIMAAQFLLMAGFSASSVRACDCLDYSGAMAEISGETDDQKYWRWQKTHLDRSEWVISGRFVPSTINQSKSFGLFEVFRVVKGRNVGSFVRIYVSNGSNCGASWLLKEAPKRPDAITLSVTQRKPGKALHISPAAVTSTITRGICWTF